MKLLFSLVITLVAGPVLAQQQSTGVSTEALSLPSLQGSISGMEMNEVDALQSGKFSFQLPIKVPKGINGLAPDLKLNYSSASGQGEFGFGWSLNIPKIYRNTKKGTPNYSEGDEFYGPEGRLIRISRPGPNTYFAAYINKDQSIYELNEALNQWIIHKADGSKLSFGLSANSVISEGDKYFEWSLNRIEDTYSNAVEFIYEKHLGKPYLKEVNYAFKNEISKYKVVFQYETRADAIRSYRSSFLVTTARRCSSISVKSGSFVIRSYVIDYDQSNGTNQSNLVTFQMKGHGNGQTNPPMPPFQFQYKEFVEPASQSTVISFTDTQIFPPSLSKSRSTIIDLNYDSFPDILETRTQGARYWLNNGSSGYTPHYQQDDFITVLGNDITKLIDVDGDRIVDILTTGLKPVFYKGGVELEPGFFGFASSGTTINSIPQYSISSPNVRTIDLNGDGRLDIFAREIGSFKSFLSEHSGKWSRAQDLALNTGAFDLSSPFAFSSDMNGDNLVDLVFIQPRSVIYLPNKGNGLFDTPKEMTFQDQKPLILDFFKIGRFNFVMDINLDGLADLLTANEDQVAYSVNQGDGTFGSTKVLSEIHDGNYNLKGLHVTTADINGNGSQDILWTNDFHDWRYLDLSNGKLNLLTKIDNGLGLVKNIEYEIASKFGTHDDALDSLSPFPVITISKLQEKLYETVSREETFSFFGSYYQKEENEHRGFSLVEKIEVGDENVDSLYTQISFEQGREANIDHFNGFMLKKYAHEYSGQIGQLLRGEENELDSLLTFDSLDERNSHFPFVAQKRIIEGDFEASTSDRTRKEIYAPSISSNGFLTSIQKSVFLDEINLVRVEETKYTENSESASMPLSVVCESNIYDSANVLLSSERFIYDTLTNLCMSSAGKITQKKAWDGTSFFTKSSYSYTNFGSLETFSDSFGHTTSISYDSDDINPISVTNAAGHTKSASYDLNTGLMTTSTDENSYQTTYYYDLYERLQKHVVSIDSITLPTSEWVHSWGNSISPSSIITKKREKSGVAGTFDQKEYFDGKGRSIGKIIEGPVDRYIFEGKSYDLRGNVALIYQKTFVASFNYPAVSSFKYFKTKRDSLGRPILAFNPQHSVAKPSYKEYYYLVGETVSYDENRNVSYEYKDSLGRRVGHKDALESETEYSFDSRDLMTTITDPQGFVTKFEHDQLKRRTCKLDSTTGLTQYAYDSEDHITEKKMFGFFPGHFNCSAPNSVTPKIIQYSYNDLLNRITKIDFPSSAGTNDLNYSYDQNTSLNSIGRLSSVNFGSGSKNFDYDQFGNVAKSYLTIGSATYLTQKQYDILGRVEKIIYPDVGSDSFEVRYQFGSDSLVSSIVDPVTDFQYVTNIKYNPVGQVEHLDFGNGLSTHNFYDYDEKSYRLEKILTTEMDVGGLTLQEIEYTHDNIGNVLSRADSKNNFLENYSYDELHRLIDADLGGTSHAWSYDNIGNIEVRDGLSYDYDNSRNQLVSAIGTTSLSWDSFGNITNDGNRVFTYDWLNRLKTLSKNSTTTSYEYDENNIRVSKSNGSLVRNFVDKYTEIEGTSVLRHIYMGSLQIASKDEVGNFIYNHADHLRSSNMKSNSSGQIEKRVEYNPFGSIRVSAGSNNKIKHGFTGQYKDDEADLMYYQQRFYDPIFGRFITADPLYSEKLDLLATNSQTLNLYSYVLNNPINNTDEHGLFTSSSGIQLSVNIPGFGISISWNQYTDSKLNQGSALSFSVGPVASAVPGASLSYVQGFSNANTLADVPGMALEKSISASAGYLAGGLAVNASGSYFGTSVMVGIGTPGIQGSVAASFTEPVRPDSVSSTSLESLGVDFGLDSENQALGEVQNSNMDSAAPSTGERVNGW